MAPISVPESGKEGSQIFNDTSEVGLTQRRQIPTDLGNAIPDPGVARATTAPSREAPQGTKGYAYDRTVLQQHVDYWDFDRDGKIYPLDTYRGFYNIGFHPILSFIAIFVIHGTFSYWSQDSWFPDPFFSIMTKNMSKTRHGSDTSVYDSEGRFIPQKFEELFTKFDEKKKGGLTLGECFKLTEAIRQIMDPVGWTAAKMEWAATYYVGHNEQGFVPKEIVRGVYDGSAFYELDKKYKKIRANMSMLQIFFHL